ncbi:MULTISPECIES: arginine deiminase [Clostridium]|uniref:Arginine deiminase n=1 Tax=Clostridium faecium TaxID=2762223 RepID=A0ABR8YU72_9CLOT|nr:MULTISPECIES: arginine deiminase [Clostridium]MBD8047785.1 arginine deiminase [Clostridium faecium]MDU1350416.1 arginine deiminase [Clostridium argentinense]
MNNFINVTSEIGKLNKVMLHRPGNEVENLVPDYLERLLFDDIPYLKVAQEEHDRFAEVLRENGTEVLYLEDLAAEVLEDKKIKDEFLNQFLKESHIDNVDVYETLYQDLVGRSTKDMVNTLMAGVRKETIQIKTSRSLRELMEDKYPFYLDPMPNLYFTRDPAAAAGNGLIINRMKRAARRRETLFMRYIHKYHKNFKTPEIPLWYDRGFDFYIEGGDELILSDKIIAIGCSERTSPEAIEVVAKNLFDNSNFEKVLVFEIPSRRAFMHLDTVFTMVDYDKFTIHPGIEGPLNVFEITRGQNDGLNIIHDKNTVDNILKNALNLPAVDLIRCGNGDEIVAAREQWNDGSNTLAIAPGRVITYERNYVTNEILSKRGIDVLTIPSAELSRGRGGPRCMSMPLNRDNLV